MADNLQINVVSSQSTPVVMEEKKLVLKILSSVAGAKGDSIYTLAVKHGYTGTEEEFVETYMRSVVDNVYDISASHLVEGQPSEYTNLAAALGIDGANIPSDLQLGGMSVKFIESTGHTYVQYRLMKNQFSTNESDWQGIDDEVLSTNNIVTGSGILELVRDLNNTIPIRYKITDLVNGLISETTGEIVVRSEQSYKASKTYYPVISGGKIKAHALASPWAAGIVFYNADKSFNSKLEGANYEAVYDVPLDACFVRICTQNYSSEDSLTLYSFSPNVEDEIVNSENLISSKAVYTKFNAVDIDLNVCNESIKFIADIINYSAKKEFQLNFTDPGNTYTSQGETLSHQNTNRDLTYYPVVPGIKLTTDLIGIGSAACIIFYKKDKSFLSSVQNDSIATVTVPENAYYARFGTESYNESRYVKIIPEINEEIDRLDGRIDTLKTNWFNLNLNFNSAVGQYINSDTQGGVSSGGGQRKCTLDYYPVSQGQTIKMSFNAASNDCVAFYDSNKVYVRKYNLLATDSNPLSITVTFEQDGYLRFSNKIDVYSSPYAYLQNQELNIEKLQEEIDENQNHIDNLDSRVTELEKYVSIKLDCSNLSQGLLNKSTGLPGATTGHSNYMYCPTYFEVKKNNVINTNAICQGSFAALCFYNADKQFVTAVETFVAPNSITVPDNDSIAYVRICTERYDSTVGLQAIIKSEKTLPEIEPLENLPYEVKDLEDRVDNLESDTTSISVAENRKPYFGIDKDSWIADETTHTFSPSSPKIQHKYVGQVNPDKRFIALGFDDFRDSDFSFIIPLLDKYGARAEFNRVHTGVDVSDTDRRRINSIVNSRHELGDHTWLHYKYPFDEPLMNGQNPSSPEGSQVPFPSNEQLRNDAGNGKNVFGRTLTHNVKTDLGYQAPNIDTTWAEMTDAQCQQLRDYYSVMKDTQTNLIVILDTLSNTYLGTTGNSRGSWDSTNEEYTGGIFTGCKTSCNHEIWERILLVTNMFLKDKFRLNYNLLTWSLPGSKESGCTFPYDGVRYYDANHTKRVGNLARFASSLYKDNNNVSKERSWTDVLREFGYCTTHDATSPSSAYCKKYQFIMNARQSRIDALSNPTNRLLSYSKMASEYTKGVDLTGTASYEVQMYDGGAVQGSTKTTFRNEIEQWRHSTANGIIWGAVIDSQDTWSERMILEGLLKYADKVGIEMITKAEAFDICFNHKINNGNLIYNPTFRNTAKEFMPTATTVPTNPDGFTGNCSVEIQDNIPVLVMGTGNTSYNHFGIPCGKIEFSAEVKGVGTITIYEIKNNTLLSDLDSATNLTVLSTINISDDTQFVEKITNFEIVDNAKEAYEQVFEGMGNKIIGVKIVFSTGLKVKNLNMELKK